MSSGPEDARARPVGPGDLGTYTTLPRPVSEGDNKLRALAPKLDVHDPIHDSTEPTAAATKHSTYNMLQSFHVQDMLLNSVVNPLCCTRQ
ncbi:hypothetical protein K491DRAFT_686432 [Lophiostoma macrostomum CBS 122681]|uniref:Uncharacterized protein n=1 Tax=Lophiostoma macrostomum CBS 122681 TaxID=1314788 RepID=A0A6A6TRW1_9PLEO|nr:hypothetical protein K491DRAFT_686432 [Lophiostoma macrostomum CBS 122681]